MPVWEDQRLPPETRYPGSSSGHREQSQKSEALGTSYRGVPWEPADHVREPIPDSPNIAGQVGGLGTGLRGPLCDFPAAVADAAAAASVVVAAYRLPPGSAETLVGLRRYGWEDPARPIPQTGSMQG